MGNRIIILLSILMFTFFGTTLVIRSLMTDADMLASDTNTITKNIHHKEAIIEKLFNDSITMKTFENVERYPSQVLDITNRYLENEFIFFYIYKNGTPQFWNTNLIVPSSDILYNEETTFVEDGSRFYVVKRHRINTEISIMALIPIKRNFNYSNEYLTNKFYNQINPTNNIEIANYDDNNLIRNVYSIDGTYLFSVKFKEGKYHNQYLTIQFICWVLGLVIFISLVNYTCIKWAEKGYAWLSVIIFTCIILLIRYASMKLNWISGISSLNIFNPRFYAYNHFLPNLWEFITMTIGICWIVLYILTIQPHLLKQNIVRNRIVGIILSAIGLISIYALGNMMFHYLSTLITHSTNINMDFSNILGFDFYSWVNLFVFCLNIVFFLYYIDIVVGQIRTMLNNLTLELNLQLIILILFLFIGILSTEATIYYNLIVGIIILIRAYSNHKTTQYHFLSFVFVLLSISLLSSIIYNKSMREVRTKEMTLTLNYLEAENDLNAMSLFMDMEGDIEQDDELKTMFEESDLYGQAKIISNYLRKTYMEAYLSKYELQFYYYIDGTPMDNYSTNKLIEYREKVINNSIRVPQTNHFYRVRSELGTHEYFLQMEIPVGQSEVQLFINFKNRSYSPTISYPEILADNRVDLIRDQYSSDLSFALYKDNNLLTQNGTYDYPSDDSQFPEKYNTHINLPDDGEFQHMMIRSDQHTTLIVSKPQYTLWQLLAVISFLFISLFTVYIITKGIQYLITVFASKTFGLRYIKYQFIVLQNRIRYSTRIQTMVITTVVAAILISGTIAFFTIGSLIDRNNLNTQENYIAEIAKKVEQIYSENTENILTESLIKKVNDLNELSLIDINIYDKSGFLIYSSQPRIYDLGLTSRYMHPIAYNALNVVKKAGGISLLERIGDFTFNSSYSTIRDGEYNTIAFINTPNYTSKREEIRNNNLLLNSLLNIYTIIILTAGFIAVFVSRRITKPLAIISQKLAQTTLNQKTNEPIYWEKNDEIGALIKEYNLMLVKMEESTMQLMNAEREYAWREMARQVAHEIKNPLTPMKLGVQQLMRSFEENDPRFEERFAKFSNSFIDQINSLSKIAVEFSNFAKLPDTDLSEINIIDKITKVANLFTSSPNTNIRIINNADSNTIFVLGDKDQLLRTFNNLIKNSIEASGGRKKHLISIIVEYADVDKLKILVKDNGSGIPKDVIPKIFQPNFTTKSSGTGLGLAFVKKTVESMKGTITFTTSEHIGTTFTIILPIHHVAE